MATLSSAKRPRIDRAFLRVMRDGRGANSSFRNLSDQEFKAWYDNWTARHRPDLAGTQVRLPAPADVRESLLEQLEEWGIPPVMLKE